MKDAAAWLREHQAVRDLETIPVTRGQLRDIVTRLNIAEGMTAETAELRAGLLVEQAFFELKRGSGT